jgi:hypothetical protein
MTHAELHEEASRALYAAEIPRTQDRADFIAGYFRGTRDAETGQPVPEPGVELNTMQRRGYLAARSV